MVGRAGLEPARSCDLRILSPTDAAQSEPSQRGDSTTDTVDAACDATQQLGVLLGVLDRDAPDLAAVVRAWPALAEPLRAAVRALVDSAGAKRGGESV